MESYGYVMEAVIIGVSDRSSLWRHGKLQQQQYPQFVEDYAKLLFEFFSNVIVTPDDGVYTDIARSFAKQSGKKPIAYYPDQDTYYGIEHIRPNFPDYELRPIGGDWYKLNADLTKEAPVTICIGLSPGVLIEACYIKYHQKYSRYKDQSLENLQLLVDTRTLENTLPSTLQEHIQNIHYYQNFQELQSLLRNLH